MNILQIGELVSHLSQGYKDKTAKKIPWRSIKQMRNIYAHNYGSIQYELAWEAATEDVPQLKDFCEAEISAYELSHSAPAHEEPDEPSLDDDDEWEQ